MILKSKKTIVTLEDQSGSAKFTFAEPPLDRTLEMQKIIAKENRTPEQQQAFWELILADLIAVEGLLSEDNTPITVSEFRSLKVPGTTVTALILAKAAAMTEAAKAEAETKNA